jgi:hypothetical protein
MKFFIYIFLFKRIKILQNIPPHHYQFFFFFFNLKIWEIIPGILAAHRVLKFSCIWDNGTKTGKLTHVIYRYQGVIYQLYISNLLTNCTYVITG